MKKRKVDTHIVLFTATLKKLTWILSMSGLRKGVHYYEQQVKKQLNYLQVSNKEANQ